MSNSNRELLPNQQNSSSTEDATKENHFRTQVVINLNRQDPNQTLKDVENQRKQTREKHINFFIDNHPERILIREPKVIKLKITLPKGYLHDTEIQKRDLETSCKLTQTDCLISNISANQDSPNINNSQSINRMFENEFIPPYKSSQILETSDFKPQLKTHSDLHSFSVEESNNLINRSLNYPPIMGKNALLAKIQATKNRQGEALPDSEIIRVLVEERFHKFLQDYYERSIKRAQRHSTLLDDDVDEPCHIPVDNSDVIVQSLLESNSDSGTSSKSSLNTSSVYSNTTQNSELSEVSKKNGSVSCNGTSSKSSLNTSSVYANTTQNFELSQVPKKNGSESCKDGSIKDQDDCKDYLEYDDKAFLRDALGEDVDVDCSECLFNTTLNDTNSTFHSKYSSGNKVSGDRSIGTSELSALLSKASSLYSSISKRMRRSATSVFRQTPISEERISTPSAEEDCFSLTSEKLSELARESAIQHQILLQTSKALNFCKKTKEFISSREQVEAERILLAAACKRELIMKELNQLEFEELVETDCKNSGTVSISHLKFTAAKRDLNQLQLQKRNKEFLQWSICIASCGLKLFASEAVLPEEDGSVCFANSFDFNKLPPDFEIHLALYSMRIKNNIRNYSHESKFHLNEEEKTTCPTPQKIFNMHKDKNKSRNKEEPLIRTSSFTLWGRMILRIADLSRATPFRLSNVPLCSNLDGTLTMSIASSVKIDERYSGFLNVGSESEDCIIWNRRWCALYGQEMRYWNYPCEENVTEPISVLNLSYCANSSISMADRRLCPRSKTLLLEIANILSEEVLNREPKYKITRHFLNADTLEEMKNWQNCLNAVVSSLRNWNATETKNVFTKSTL